MGSLESAIRALVLFQSLLLIGVFLSVRRPDHVRWLGVALAGAIGAFAIASIPAARSELAALYWPSMLWCVAKPALLWIFARAVFADRYVLRGGDVAAAAGLIAAGVWQDVALEPGQARWQVWASTVLLDSLALFFIARVPIDLWQEQRLDLDPLRRRIRAVVLPAASLYLACAVAWQLFGFVSQTTTPEVLRLANLLCLWLGALAVFLSLIRVEVTDWPALAARRPATVLTANECAVLARLETLLRQPRWFADPALSLVTLARQLATNEQSLRHVIQAGLGHRHVTDFLHQHSLAAARALLADVEAEKRTVLSIALESGFRSIGPFNRAFRDAEGCTPTEYRRRELRTTHA